MAFGSLVVAQLLHALHYRSSKASVFERGGLSSNSRLVQIVAGSLATQVAAMLVPGVRSALNIAPVGLIDAGALLAGGVLPFLIGEAQRSGSEAVLGGLDGLYFRRPDFDLISATETPSIDAAGHRPKRLATR